MIRQLLNPNVWMRRAWVILIMLTTGVPIVVSMFSTAFLQWLPMVILALITSSILITLALMLGNMHPKASPEVLRERRMI